MEDKKLLTPEEIAEKLGMSPKTIRDWCRSGQVKGVKVGKAGLWRVPASELDNLIAETAPTGMRKIGVALSKGGVGKTTTAVNLSAGLAKLGKKVLLIDTDTQGQVSVLLGVDPEYGLADVLIDDIPIETAITQARDNLHLLAGGDELAMVKGTILKELEQPQLALASKLEKIEDDFDFVIIDTAPSWDILNLCVLFYVHEVLVPISLEILSIQGFSKFKENLDSVAKYQQNLELKYILPTFLDRRVKRSEEILKQLKTTYPEMVCDPIRYNSRLAEAPGLGQTIFEFDPRSAGAKDYNKLISRIMKG